MRSPLNPARAPTAAASLIMLAIFLFGSLRYDHFASLSNTAALFNDYAYIIIAAIGATFVILSGGIDLSTGSAVAFTNVLIATLVDRGCHPIAAATIAIVGCTTLGALTGWVIDALQLPAFIVTLCAMFALRAAAFLILDRSAAIDHSFFSWASHAEIPLGAGATLSFHTDLALFALAAALVLARLTPFGANILALGGSERAARSMGVPIARTRILTYALAGLCSSLAGSAFTLYKQSGDPTSAVGLELIAIAAVVIGGTSLSGGTGSILGTLVGVLIIAVIRTIIDFQGNLNAAWTSIATGGLLLVFVCLQRALTALARRSGER